MQKSIFTSKTLSNWQVVLLGSLFLLSIFCRLKNINKPLLDAHFFRQTQTATVVRNFVRSGIDVFHTKLDVFGTGREETLLLEFPFYQSMVSVLSLIFGFSDSIGRIVSIISGLIGGLILFFLAFELFNSRLLSFISLVFYLFAPLNIYFQQAYMIESTVVTLHLLALFFWLKYANYSNRIYLFLSILVTVLAFIQKSIYAPFLIFPIIFIQILFKGKRKFYDKAWIAGLIISIVILIIWQWYVDVTNITNNHINFSIQDMGQQLWNFGTIIDRLSLSLWLTRLNAVLGSLTKLFVAAVIAGIIFLPKNWNKSSLFVLVWLISLCFYYLIFFRIQSHEYYFMIIIPVLSIIASLGLNNIICIIRYRTGNNKLLLSGLISIFLTLFIMKGYQNSLPFFNLNEGVRNDLNTINRYLIEKGYVLFVFPQYDWNSVWSYYTDRKGLIVSSKDVTIPLLQKIKGEGYKYAVFYGINDIYSENISLVEIMRKYSKEEDSNIGIYTL